MDLIESIAQLKAILAAPRPGELDGWLEVNDDETILLAIRYLLKEQDKKTRHACAEAVLGCPQYVNGHIVRQDAHRVCMNVQAI